MTTATNTAKAPRKPRVAAPAASTGNSTIASLESRATSQSAQAPRAEALKVGPNFTGQYLYDRFVNTSTEDVSKMNVVRQMVGALDTASFKAVVGDMVKLAKEQADSHVGTNLQSYYDARLKTARNHQSVMRNAYGALKFYSDAMDEAGVDNDTGYHVINTIAKAVLTAKKVNWDGTPIVAKEQREKDKAVKQEAKIMTEVMHANPKGADETREAYYARIDKLVAEAETKLAEETKAARLADLADKMRTLAGEDLADLIALLAK